MAERDPAGMLTTLPPEAIRLAHALAAYFQAHDDTDEPLNPFDVYGRNVIAYIAEKYDPESNATGSSTDFPASWANDSSQVYSAIVTVFNLAFGLSMPSTESRPTRSLLDLPVELLLLIERQLPDKDVHSLCRTNRHLYHALSDSLRQRGLRNLRAFLWALKKNNKQAFAKAVEALTPLPRTMWSTPRLQPHINNRNVHLVKLMAFKGGLLGQQLEHLIDFVLRVSRERTETPSVDKWQSIKNCLEWGLSPNYVFEDGWSLMAQAIVKSIINPYKQFREVKVLLSHGADMGCLITIPDNDSMLHLACLYYQPKIVQILLEKRLFDRHELKSNDRDNLLDILIQDPNVRIDERDSNGRTPLSLAAGHSVNLSMAKKFVNRAVHLPDRIDINIQDNEGKTPLCHAISIKEPYMVRLFVNQHRLDPNLGPADAFPLLLAVVYDKLPILEILLDSKQLDLNKQNSEGETALLKALHIGNTEAVKLLARAGADPDFEPREGVTARQACLDAGLLVRWRVRPI
ncbi:uncharacterized protein N7515_005071 [Penicillium bovifimosum]|uniref:F-box domain-containing protein n=1 Tax=Penicillium bovifimosum TaxID=126998 RepID=A0A9W9H1P7_9EURO|nr:uncharacterized protein N7515_005071 [Penicillium bovifimosum]KAJ5135793.1 hypothetical protein N7515_005071 [Penicillium bovifimosum]